MASGTWAVDANGNWSLATNWASSVIADGASDAANFTNNITAARTVTIDTTSRTIGTVNLADSTATFFGWTLAASGGAGLTLDNGASAPTITVNNAASTISAPLSGTNGFTKLGTQALTLTGTNPVSGTITVSAGTLTAGANGTTGDFGAAANSIVVSSGATASVNRSNAYTIDGSITGVGTFSKVTGTGTLTLTNGTISVSTMTLSVGTTEFSNAGAQNVSSVIGGAGAITKSLGGTLTFSGGGANTGAWAVNSGTLAITTAAQTGTTGTITVASGANLAVGANVAKPITSNGTYTQTSGTVSGSVTLNQDAAITGGSITGTLATANAAGNVAKLTVSSPGSISLSTVSPWNIASNATSRAAVYQSGNITYPDVPATTHGIQIGANAASTSYGYWYGKSGTLTVGLNSFLLVGAYYPGSGQPGAGGPAVVDFVGATLNQGRGFGIGNSPTNSAVVNFLTGAHTHTQDQIVFGGSTAASTQVTGAATSQQRMTLQGATTTYTSGGGVSMYSNATGALCQMNIRDGASGKFTYFTTAGASPKEINLINGGKLALTAGSSTSGGGFNLTLYGTGNKLGSAGGAAGTLAASIRNATGNGVASIPIAPGNEGSDYIGAPIVVLSGGGGTGASARAVWDETTKKITSFEITNPGINYTSAPTVTLSGATLANSCCTTEVIPGTPTLAANSTDGAIEKIDTGLLALTGTNTNTGAYTVSAGTLQIGNGAAAGSIDSTSGVSIAAGANFYYGRSDAKTWTLPITSTSTSTIGVNSTGTLTLAADWLTTNAFTGRLYIGSTGGLTVNQTVDVAVQGLTGAGGGTFTKNGAAKLTFNTTSSNTAAWQINAGTIDVTAAQTGTSGTITVAAGATLTSTAAISKPITINSGSTGNDVVLAGSAALSVSGTITTSGTSTRATTVTATGNLTSNGSIGALTVAVGGVAVVADATTGNLLLSGIGTSFTTATATTNGQLFLGNTAGTAVLTIPANRTITTNVVGSSGNAQGHWTGYAANAPSALYQTGANSLLAATVGSGSGYCESQFNRNAFGYYLLGAGNLTTAAAAHVSFYQGIFDVNGGAVSVGGSFNLYSTTTVGTHTYITSGTHTASSLRLGGAIAGDTTTLNVFGAGASFTTGAVSVPLTTGDRKLLTVNNGGRLVVGTITPSGTGNVPVIYMADGSTFGTTGTVPATVDLYAGGTDNKLTASTGSGIIATPIKAATNKGLSAVAMTSAGAGYIGPPSLKVTTSGAGVGANVRAVFNVTTQTITGIEVVSPGSGYQDADTTTITVLSHGTGTGFTPGAITLAVNPTTNAVEKIDSGTLTLTATNTNTGAYTVSAGTLRIGNAGTTGTLGNGDASNASVASGATLAFGRSDARTYSNIISGAGTIAVNGGGRTTLSGVNTFTSAAAAIAISTANSILRVTNNDSIGQGTTFGITVASGTAFEIDGTSGDLTGLPAKALSLTGTGITAGGALRNIAGNNTYAGTITLAAASRINSDAGTLTLSSVSAITGATFGLTFGGAGDVSVGSAINTTTGVVIKDGAGFTDLRAASSTYTGKTTVSAGTLGYVTAAAAGSASSFGQPAAGANAIVDVAGAATAGAAGGVRFTGSSPQTFSRTINITGATAGFVARFESSGSAAVTHSTAFTNTTTNQTRTYQFGGTGTAANTVSFVVSNNGTGAVSITKADAGKWTLTNTSNSYTGATTVNGGTLVLSVATWAAGAKVTSTSTVTVNASAKIQTLTGTGGSAQNGRHTYSNLTFAANGRIRIGG